MALNEVLPFEKLAKQIDFLLLKTLHPWNVCIQATIVTALMDDIQGDIDVSDTNGLKKVFRNRAEA